MENEKIEISKVGRFENSGIQNSSVKFVYSILKRLVLLFLVIALADAYGQTKLEQSHSGSVFEGEWINKKEGRFLRIFYDEGTHVFIIDDWLMHDEGNTDTYTAVSKGDRLILYTDTVEHLAPYCELRVVDTKLVYRCNPITIKENRLLDYPQGSVSIFERKKKSK